MFAICTIQGKQYKVAEGDHILVHRLPDPVGAHVTFDSVLGLLSDEKMTTGKPFVRGASVTAEIEAHSLGKKIRVFKRLRRKDMRKTRGHRQQFTQLKITQVIGA